MDLNLKHDTFEIRKLKEEIFVQGWKLHIPNKPTRFQSENNHSTIDYILTKGIPDTMIDIKVKN